MPTKNYQVRSISLPSRSHPTTSRVEEELNKVRAFETESSVSTSKSISKGLSRLEDLYQCVDELLQMASTQRVLSHQKWIEQVLDSFLRLLDICGITRDSTLQINEHVRTLQSSLRRRKQDSSLEISIAHFISFRKLMKKDLKKLITTLKIIDRKFETNPELLEQNEHLCAVIRVLREVCEINIFIFQALLVFLSESATKKANKSGWFSKFIHKGAVVCEEKQVPCVNQLEDVDFALSGLWKCEGLEVEKIQMAKRRLEMLEMSINEIENGLEKVFRCLIKTRTSLLNIFSQ